MKAAAGSSPEFVAFFVGGGLPLFGPHFVPPAAAAPSGAVVSTRDYLEMVRMRVENKKRYPDLARKPQLEGQVGVRFVIAPDGPFSRRQWSAPPPPKSSTRPPWPPCGRRNRFQNACHALQRADSPGSEHCFRVDVGATLLPSRGPKPKDEHIA
jgi:hypothetical protein